MECIWTIETDVGHQVLLHINRLGAAETVEVLYIYSDFKHFSLHFTMISCAKIKLDSIKKF